MESPNKFTLDYNQRLNELDKILASHHLDGIALNPGPSLIYFTGLRFHLSERPVVLIYRTGYEPTLLLPALELAKIQELTFPIKAYPYGDDPSTWQNVFNDAISQGNFDDKSIGIEPQRLRLLEYRYLTNSAPQASFVSGEQAIASLRMSKNTVEIMAMRKAVEVAQNALIATLPIINIGMTERDIAAELTLQLLRQGSDTEMPFAPIVSGGPNSANPHATPTERPLTHGDLLVIDWGAAYHGYFSDITRTFSIGEIQQEEKKICETVLRANTAGREAVRPGASAHEIDKAARSVIEKASFGEYFTHRTGHGLGLEGHEEPYIREGNNFIVRPGMTFTIEPGVYLPDRNGVRIEDDVVVTELGFDSLTTLPREVTRLV